MIDKAKTCQGCPDRIMDGIGTRDEWYDERMIDDDMSVATGLLDENA